jgi:tripartite-type tricarboxylate transporter receptor subunit TctC
MPSNIALCLVRLLSFVACCLSSVICYGQSYPTHPIQVIVPFAGGSASDVITRVVLERMGDAMGRRFIVDNRSGAGGNTGTAAAARAEPDGYTLAMSTSGPLAANRTLYQDLGYDPENDFAPIGLFAMIPNIIVVSIDTLHQQLAAAIADPAVRARVVELGAEPVISTPDELAKFIRSETVKWRDIIVNAGVQQL